MPLHLFFAIVFSCLYFQAQSTLTSLLEQHFSAAFKPPLMNAKATSTGIIPITWPLYAVNVDFTDLSDEGNLNPLIPSGQMGIALYTNESFFGGNCTNFLNYNCSQPHCFPSVGEPRNNSFLYFEVQGYTSHAQLFMDYNFFSNGYMNFIYAQNCSPEYTLSTNMVYGIIGMGLGGLGIHNFVGKYPTFSVYLEDGGLNGSLIFDCDSTKIKQDGKKQIAHASSNWEISFTNVSVNETQITYDGIALFDINTPFIGIPESLYTEILNTLQSSYGLDCFDPNVYLLGCAYQGNYLDLPSIKVDASIEIPPQVYLHPIVNNTYNLLINPLSSNSSDLTSTFVTKRYQNSVILGAPFLQYYYVCFEAKPKRKEILIYEKDSNPEYNPTKTDTAYIVLAITIPIFLCLIFVGLSYRKSDYASKKRIVPEINKEKQSFVLLFDSTDKDSLVEPLADDNKFVPDTKKKETDETKPAGSIFDAMGKLSSKHVSSEEVANMNASVLSGGSENIN